jgi:hypothetical protein
MIPHCLLKLIVIMLTFSKTTFSPQTNFSAAKNPVKITINVVNIASETERKCYPIKIHSLMEMMLSQENLIKQQQQQQTQNRQIQQQKQQQQLLSFYRMPIIENFSNGDISVVICKNLSNFCCQFLYLLICFHFYMQVSHFILFYLIRKFKYSKLQNILNNF